MCEMEGVVFYCDLLGFRTTSKEAAAGEDVLTTVWNAVEMEIPDGPNGSWVKAQPWEYCLGLSDSIFCFHSDVIEGLKLASRFIMSLVSGSLKRNPPILVRGGLAYGKVRSKWTGGAFKGEDLRTGNLVGPAVVEAAEMEDCGLRGPRLLLHEDLGKRIRDNDSTLANWLLRPTPVSNVWEVLWMLPDKREEVDCQNARCIKSWCQRALELCVDHGGHKDYGEHYREFLLLAAHVRERAIAAGVSATPPPVEWLDEGKVRGVLASASGIPDGYINTLLRVLSMTR